MQAVGRFFIMNTMTLGSISQGLIRKGFTNDTFYSCLYCGHRISDPVYPDLTGRMDHRQIFSYDQGYQLSSDHSGCISIYPVDHRSQSHSIGEENVPKDTPVLYIGNHRSYFDILLTYSRCPIRTGYIAKKEMEKIPLLSTWMKYLHCLFLDRKDIKQGLKTILTAVDKVKSGISICIFPEGTRNKNTDDLDMLPFHEGSFKIATKTKCPIIPIAINNSADIFEAHFPKIRPAKVVVEYGKPIYPDELDKETKKHLGEYTQGIIHQMLEKNKSLTQ